jgi:hypothetical protein
LAINYADERVTVTSAQLKGWTGWVSGTDLELRGKCPVCLHDSPVTVHEEFTALEGKTVAGSQELAISMTCACDELHRRRPAKVEKGCGRRWSCTSTTDDKNQVTLTELSDPQLVAAAEALLAAGTAQLADVRSLAQKWMGGVTALFSLFSLAGITFTRSTVTGLGTGWQVLIAIFALAAAVLAALAVYLSYRAAYGWPITHVISDNDQLRDWFAARQAAPRVQTELMKLGMLAAAGALGALLVTVGLLWFAPQPAPTGPLVRATLSNKSQVCGTLLPSAQPEEPIVRRASDGTAIGIPVKSLVSLTAVSSC